MEATNEMPRTETAPAAPRKRAARLPAIALGAIAVLGVGGYFVHRAMTAGEESTDDAQVEADVVPVAARIGGVVLHVRVRDNATVHSGDLLIELDPAEAEARERAAEAELETAEAQASEADAQVSLVEATSNASLHTARASVTSARDLVRSAGTQVSAAQAALDRASAQANSARTTLERIRALALRHVSPQSQLDDAQTAYEAAQASEAQARAQLAAAMAARQTAGSQVDEAQGRLEQSSPVDVQIAAARARARIAHAREASARAALDLARLSLSYMRVTAPHDGVVSRMAIREGQLIQTGQSIAMLVPSHTYLVANFKETQVGHMRPGDLAEAHIDAYSGRTFHGRVESISGGTGARFSLLPPDNASGNFVRVVQRVPVRIEWTDVPRDLAMRAGLSADVTVYVDQ